MKRRAFALVLAFASAAQAEPVVDAGVRAGLALPVGAFDRATRAGDTTFGGTPLGLDLALALDPQARWRVELGVLGLFTPTTPRLCGSTSECISSFGRDLELDVLARVRGPARGRLSPEAELAFGWSWSVRRIDDSDQVSTRRWSGPVLLRAAAVPTLRLGRSTRLGLVIGGSLARSSSFELSAPGVERRGLSGTAFSRHVRDRRALRARFLQRGGAMTRRRPWTGSQIQIAPEGSSVAHAAPFCVVTSNARLGTPSRSNAIAAIFPASALGA